MKSKKQKIILFLKIAFSIFILGLVLLFAFRNTLLYKIITRVDTKLERDYSCSFSINKASFDGITALKFEGISLVPKNHDTLVYIEKMNTKINFWKLLLGDVQLGKLEVNNGFIQLIKDKNGSNFDAFLKSKKDKTDDKGVNYAKFVNRILSQLLDLIPTDLQVKNFDFKVNDNGNKVILDCAEMLLQDKKLTSTIIVKSNLKEQIWNISGFADPRDRKTDLMLTTSKNDTIKIPFLDQKFNLKAGFNNIHFVLDEMEMNSGKLNVKGYASTQKFFINHPKIASKEVQLNDARFEYHLVFGERFVALDSTSKVQIDKLILKPYLSYTNDKDKIYSVQLEIPKIKGQDFIDALPKGLFSHFEDMKATGSFQYKLKFEYNNNHSKNIILESNLTKDNLKITDYGASDLNKINTEFIYRAIEKGVPQRPIVVGTANPYFTPLTEISPYLQKSVLTSEDPSFMQHRGFINDAFKQSIAKNIKTKKFARGASTISMQLVKNVFLTREKTLSRKLEEIMLVYILENQRITSKERMLEVYFNVIEFGPNVYGIGEAAAFYFQKKPMDLTLNECLFLATIVPKPKGFMYKFDGNQALKPNAKQEHKFLTNVMLRRNVLEPNDTIGQHFPLKINGQAQYFLKSKSLLETEIDTTNVEEFDF